MNPHRRRGTRVKGKLGNTRRGSSGLWEENCVPPATQAELGGPPVAERVAERVAG